MFFYKPGVTEPEIGLLAGASYWPGMCIGHILGSTCGGCGKRRRSLPVMGAQGEAIPLMGAFGGPLWRTAPALTDICGNYDLWDFVSVHATYPL